MSLRKKAIRADDGGLGMRENDFQVVGLAVLDFEEIRVLGGDQSLELVASGLN